MSPVHSQYTQRGSQRLSVIGPASKMYVQSKYEPGISIVCTTHCATLLCAQRLQLTQPELPIERATARRTTRPPALARGRRRNALRWHRPAARGRLAWDPARGGLHPRSGGRSAGCWPVSTQGLEPTRGLNLPAVVIYQAPRPCSDPLTSTLP